MTRFQLVFRGSDGDGDRSEYRYNNAEGEPPIDGKLSRVRPPSGWRVRAEALRPAAAGAAGAFAGVQRSAEEARQRPCAVSRAVPLGNSSK